MVVPLTVEGEDGEGVFVGHALECCETRATCHAQGFLEFQRDTMSRNGRERTPHHELLVTPCHTASNFARGLSTEQGLQP